MLLAPAGQGAVRHTAAESVGHAVRASGSVWGKLGQRADRLAEHLADGADGLSARLPHVARGLRAGASATRYWFGEKALLKSGVELGVGIRLNGAPDLLHLGGLLDFGGSGTNANVGVTRLFGPLTRAPDVQRWNAGVGALMPFFSGGMSRQGGLGGAFNYYVLSAGADARARRISFGLPGLLWLSSGTFRGRGSFVALSLGLPMPGHRFGLGWQLSLNLALYGPQFEPVTALALAAASRLRSARDRAVAPLRKVAAPLRALAQAVRGGPKRIPASDLIASAAASPQPLLASATR